MYDAASLKALVDEAIPESQAIEFKEMFELKSREQRVELLKDLSGMGNGGGGTVLFGVAEDDEGHNTAAEVRPLLDRSLPGRIENVVRAGVSPPLLYGLRAIEVSDGFVLEAKVDPSPIGPYMVTNYSDTRHRYFKRHGTRVDPMSEQEVRDAYALAMRAAEHRPVIWAAHHLPMSFDDRVPRVCIAALPLEPLPELLDLRRLKATDLLPPEPLSRFIKRTCDLTPALVEAVRWAEGFGGASPLRALVRLHRDGAAWISQTLDERIAPVYVATIADAILTYLGWLWREFDLRRPVELKLSVTGLSKLKLSIGDAARELSIVQPWGVEVPSVDLDAECEPWDIATPSSRHRLVQNLADHLVQAYGLAKVDVPFTAGHLYGPDGEPLSMTLHSDLWTIWSQHHRSSIATFDPSGAVKANYSGHRVAHVDGGVIVDLAGDTLAVVELGVGSGYPRDYYPLRQTEGELPEDAEGRPSPPARGEMFDVPEATGNWSKATLRATLEDYEAGR